MTMRAVLGKAEGGHEPFLNAVRNRVLQPMSLAMHFMPGHSQQVGQKALNNSVSSHHDVSKTASCGSQVNRSVFLSFEIGICCKSFEHLTRRRQRDAERLSKDSCSAALPVLFEAFDLG